MRQLNVLRAVVADRRLRRLEGAYLFFALTENATWLAITVWAFARGGVREAGIAAFVQLAPAGVAAPIVAYAGDRFRRDRVLAAGIVAVAIASITTGAAMTAGMPAVVVYALAAVTASSTTAARPAIGAILPSVTEEPHSLTAANVGVGLIDNLGLFAGPAIAGAMLAVTSPGVVFIAFGAMCVLGSVLVVSIDYEPARVRPTGDVGAANLVAELRGGLGRVAADPTVRAPLAVATASFVVAGALDVFFVAVAIDLLDGTDALAGVLSAGFGFGGVTGAVASIGLIGAARLRPAIGMVAGLSAFALVLLANAPPLAVTILALALAGAGIGGLEVACRTLIQRSSADDVLARVLGVMETGLQLGMAFGALGAGLVAEAVGVRWALVGVAAVLPLAFLAAAGGLGRADAAATLVDRSHVELLRRLPIFGPLGSPAIEQVAMNLRPVRAEPGDEIVREGDQGDRFYVIVEGLVEVGQGDRTIRRMGPGEAFGEIALVRDVPRTATVRALETTTLHAIGRSVFLEAVTGHPRALANAEDVTDHWLEADGAA